MMRSIQLVLLMLTALGAWSTLNGQISTGGDPVSFQTTYSKEFSDQKLKKTTIPALDLARVLKEDKENPGANRFAAPVEVDMGLKNSGQWTSLSNGDRVWRLHINAENALAVSILYDNFYIPPGARLFVYSPDKSQVLGAYTSINNRKTNRFMTGLIKGDEAIIEYFEPKRVKGLGQVHIFRIDQAYKKDVIKNSDYEFQVHAGAAVTNSGFGSSFDCHPNVACDTAAEVREKKNGICRIMVVVEEGTGFCTGNLMNNTSVDGKPFVLSAFHCQDGFTPLYDFWKFDFGYETLTCSGSPSEPTAKSILGANFLSGRQESDFILLELISPIPEDFDVFYLGWDRSGDEPDSMTYIHHPLGDIKKIGRINRPSEVFDFPIEWDNGVTTPSENHLRIVYNTGSFQPGSSGAALLDNRFRVVGQLHGGNSSCESSTGYFGRISQSWVGGGTPDTRLRDWLDPLNTNAMTLDGTKNTGRGASTLGGVFLTEAGEPIPGVTITLMGPKVEVATTDAEGRYEFGGLKPGERYGLMPSKDGNDINGVTVNDVIIIQKHVLATDIITNPFTLLASDVDRSGSVSTIDRIKIQKLIIGLEDEFTEAPSWQFIPKEFVFSDPTNPFLDEIDDTFYIEEFTESRTSFDFIGYKTGDANKSADPKK